jgi:PAS domain S-box-containing protein
VDDVYRHVARQLPGGAAFVVWRDLRYMLAEGGSLADTGMSAQRFEGRKVRDMVPAEAVDQVEADYAEALNGGTFQREHAVGERWFVTQGVPLRDHSGDIYAALAVSFDVTSMKRAESELRNSETALRELHRRKDVFLATLAHELRNPLAPLAMGVDLLRRLPLDSAQAERTYRMLRSQIGQITR